MKNLNENFKCFMDPIETLLLKWDLSKDTFFYFFFIFFQGGLKEMPK